MPHELLKGACDIHVHAAPDISPRAQDVLDVARAAAEAGMSGLGIKDHTTSTAGRVFALNRMHPAGPHYFSSVALNPPVGGLNPCAVRAALRAGVDIVYFPTYAAQHHVETLGTPSLPLPDRGFRGLSILDETGILLPQVELIVDWIARFDGVLATGHLSPRESLALLRFVRGRDVRRMIVTHASEPVPSMSVEDQLEAAALGAFIEHSFFAVTAGCPRAISLEHLRDQIRAVGPEHIILSSDFGQPANGPAVAGFAHYLDKLHRLGVSSEDLRQMTVENPQKLLGQRQVRPEGVADGE
jgi:hypothetical protein